MGTISPSPVFSPYFCQKVPFKILMACYFTAVKIFSGF